MAFYVFELGVLRDVLTATERTARWLACHVCGLAARMVGGQRVVAARVGGGRGVGKNRRRRRAAVISERGPLWASAAQHQRVAARAETVDDVHSVDGPSGLLEDCGSRLGRWRGKCLHNAVLALARGKLWGRLRVRFERDACDHAGAGLGGSRAEKRNMFSVWKALRAELVSVIIVGCRSLADARAGCVASCAEFGSVGRVSEVRSQAL